MENTSEVKENKVVVSEPNKGSAKKKNPLKDPSFYISVVALITSIFFASTNIYREEKASKQSKFSQTKESFYSTLEKIRV